VVVVGSFVAGYLFGSFVVVYLFGNFAGESFETVVVESFEIVVVRVVFGIVVVGTVAVVETEILDVVVPGEQHQEQRNHRNSG